MQQKRLRAKGIFLDLDGTIVDSTEAYIEAAKIAFNAINVSPPQKELLLEIPRRMEQRLPFHDITGLDTKLFVKHYLAAYYSVTETKTKLIPNAQETLQALSKRAKLAVITMRHAPNELICKELDSLGIAHYFSYVVTALDTAKPKPSPEALIRCVEALDVDMCDCIIAGDSINDIKAGKAAGAGTVAVLSGLYRREELLKESPDLVLNDISLLPEFIE